MAGEVAGGGAARSRGTPSTVSWNEKCGFYSQPNKKPSDDFLLCLSVHFLFQESF